MTLGEWINHATLALKQIGIERPRAEAGYLVSAVTNLGREAMIANPDQQITNTKLADLDAALQRRCAFEPLAYIRGSTDFFGREFTVTKDVLIPRPETEGLVEAGLEHLKQRAIDQPAIVDFGTGSGCIALSLLAEHKTARAIGVDISQAALKVATINAERLGVAARFSARHGNWGDGIDGSFDLIVSNPPYIDRPSLRSLMPDVRDYEPMRALDGGDDGLDAYRILATHTARLLSANGMALFEIGMGQAQDVTEIILGCGLQCATQYDLAGIERIIVAKLTEY